MPAGDGLSVGLCRTPVMDTRSNRDTWRSPMSSMVLSPGLGRAGVRRPARQPARSETAVRLTRRGRLVVTLLFLLVALTVLTVFGARSAASGEAGTPVPTRTVVVAEGDTLWGIAAEVAAPGQVREMVHQIEELNALAGPELLVGQRVAGPLG
jgi:hypothetical protein